MMISEKVGADWPTRMAYVFSAWYQMTALPNWRGAMRRYEGVPLHAAPRWRYVEISPSGKDLPVPGTPNQGLRRPAAAVVVSGDGPAAAEDARPIEYKGEERVIKLAEISLVDHEPMPTATSLEGWPGDEVCRSCQPMLSVWL